MKRMKSALCVFGVSLVFMLTFFPCSLRADALDNWHLRDSGTPKDLNGVTYGNNRFVVGGGYVGGYGNILTSLDGANWDTSAEGITDDELGGVAYGNGTFVVVGGMYTLGGGYIHGTILTSPDGANLNWNISYSGTIDLHQVTYGNSTFIAVGFGSDQTGSYAAILTSPDGVTWNTITPGFPGWLMGVTYGNNSFVAVGTGGTILTSTDGQIWKQSVSGTTNHLIEVTYGNNTFVAVGLGGTILISSDNGQTWSPKASGTTNQLNGVTFGNNTFVAVGLFGTILDSSDNGQTWSSKSSGTTNSLNKVAYGNNTFVAVGNGGTILQSDPVTQTFDFDSDSNGWRGIGLYDDGTLTPVSGWFVDVPAPWSNADGNPALGVIGVGSPNALVFPPSPSGSQFLHADLVSPDLGSYTEWQGITSFSYNVTGIWILENQPVAVQAVLRVRKPDSSISYFTDGTFYNVPTWPSGSWATHTVDATALGLPSGATILNVNLRFFFYANSGLDGFVVVDHVVPTTAQAPSLSVTPSDGLTSSGNQGGPFSPSSKIYTLRNVGGISLNWTVAKTKSWTTLSSASGTLAAGASTTVMVSINSTANSLAVGSYSDTVSFTNTTNGNGNTTRPVSLTVTPAPWPIIDNLPAGQSDAYRSFTGTWCTSGVAGYYGVDSLYSCGSGTNTYRWTPNVPTAGTYNVYIWYTSSSTRSTSVPISVTHAAGTTTKTFNEQTGGGQWVLHGTYSFNAGTGGYVQVSSVNGLAVADAVKFEPSSGPVLSVTPANGLTATGPLGGPFSPSSKGYTLQNTGGSSMNWTAAKTQSWTTLSSASGTLAGGASTTVTVSINSNANSLAAGSYSDTVSFANTTNGNGNTSRPVSLTVSPAGVDIILDNAPAGQSGGGRSFTGTWCTSGVAGYYGTDSLYSCGSGTDTYRWTPTIATAGTYSVYIWYASSSTRSTSVPVSVTYAGGTATKTFNEQTGGGQWVLHGTYSFNAGTGGYVQVSDVNGLASADAVKFHPVTGPTPIILDNAPAGQSGGGRSFTGTWCTSGVTGYYGTDSLYSCGSGTDTYKWTPTIPAAGNYNVYIWWTSSATRSTTVPISVTHAAGTTTKTFNEQTGGGQWVLHGTYSFNAGTGGYVQVSDINGLASADAVKFEPTP